MNNSSYNITFEETLQKNSIPPSNKPISSIGFTRWGRDGRYWAKMVSQDVIIFGDWSQGINEVWHAKNETHHRSRQELEDKTSQLRKARDEAEIEQQEYQEKIAVIALERWHNALSNQIQKHPYIIRKGIQPLGARLEGKNLIVPLYDITGKLWTLQTIDQDGNKRFLAGGKKKACFHQLGALKESDLLYVCEGFATGASIYMATGIPTIVAFDAGSLDPVIGIIKSTYPEKTLIICGDNDQWKENNVGKEKAEAAAAKYDCSVVLPYFSIECLKLAQTKEVKPTDFNDLHMLQGLEEVKRQLNNNGSSKPKNILPTGFISNDKGIFYEEMWICSPIEILAHTCDENNENWGRLVKFADLQGHIHQLTIAMEWLGGEGVELFNHLLSLGLRLNTKRSAKNRFIEYLQGIKVNNQVLCTSRVGWYKDLFILPDGPIPQTHEVYLQSDNNNFIGFHRLGTLEEWQEKIAKPCIGNSRLIFALSCAFAAPLLPLVHAESGGFNLKGASSIGKSTALAVAASVWGSPKYIQQWKTTGNALEAVAEAHNDCLLCLDELGQVDGKEAAEIIYMLANGSGKNRLKAKGGLRKKYQWETIFLSSGEVSLADKVNEAGKKAQAGIFNRMVDIPADANKGYRLFDTIHDYADGNALALHLKESCRQYYGTPIRSFLPYLIRVKEKLPHAIQELKTDFLKKYVPVNADGQVKRVAERFILIAFAGELAIKLKILPFEMGAILEGVSICFQAWLEERGGIDAHEIEEGLKQVQAFIQINQSSRFAIIDKNIHNHIEQKIINLAGYKRQIKDGGYEFFIFTEVFRKEICKGFDHKMICNELVKKGWLIRGSDRQFVSSQRLPTGPKKIYHLTTAVLAEE